MPIAILTTLVDHKMMRILASIAITLSCFACHAATVYPVVDICRVLGDMDKFDGQTIELHSEVKFTMHGRHLFGSRCYESGSLGLSIPEERSKERTVGDFVQRVMSEQGRASVVLIGQFVREPTKNFMGYFILEKVVEVK